ncbi:VWD domain-containing protein [Plantactinospora sp. ZYX-F-223]|uniref:VWD domain-containing protein n=1 Tax=Plantactinospora sp. ZYX-F-223 TaxID=3144103 RepID=UPI0031FC3942
MANVTLLVILLSTAAPTGAAAGAPATTENLQAWQTKMEQVAEPSATGCFTARYPRLVWRETACVAAPATPMEPRIPGPTPLSVGSYDHLVAESPTGSISRAEGTFEQVTGVASVRSPIELGGPDVINAYTLQLNTNYFTTPLCNPDSDSCQGWQQFIFANDGTSGLLFIEYWLLNYASDDTTPCPATWSTHSTLGGISCYKDTPAKSIPVNTLIKDMSKFALTGDISKADAEVTFTPDAGITLHEQKGPKILDVGSDWKQAEFNVFGYGNGTQATFNSGASTRVRTRIDYGGTVEPNCVTAGFTAESNNLFLGDLATNPPAPPKVGPPPATAGPALIFYEKSGSGILTAECSRAVTVGDTHQATFAGLLYDFQASGDFVEAQVGPAFEVQSRKVSGAPSWPNTSVNRSAAVRMGNTTVAVCEGTRLIVDGAPAALPPGGSVTLPSGVRIQRAGNIHYVRDASGNGMRVELRGAYIDLHVGLGRWPTTVRGLLGNPNNDPTRLEARDGAQFVVPSSFNTQFFNFLYNRFGPSWRVPATSSLLAPCNTVTPGNPTAPFFARDLPWELRQSAELGCRQAGVAQAWLDTCTLDVAVLGTTSAAAVYVGRGAPIVDGNRTPPDCAPAGCRESRHPFAQPAESD